MSLIRHSAIALVLLPGCNSPDPAPTTLDALLHFFWQEYEAGDDPYLAEGLRNLDGAVGALEEGMEGTVTPLVVEEAWMVDTSTRDVGAAQGLFVARTFACSLPVLEEILYQLDQDVLYPDVYDAYARAYTTDLGAYTGREVSVLSWTTDYTATLLGTSYDAHLLGDLRYVPDLGAEENPFGAFLLARVVMPEPATFEDGSDQSMDQDFQVEVFWERPGGIVAHAYGIWRQAVYAGGLDMASDGVQRLTLDNMSDWDDQTEVLCAAGIP